MSVPVYLGTLDTADVAVEAYADAGPDAGPERLTMDRVGELPGAVNGGLYQVGMDTRRAASDYTPRVVPRHPNAVVPIEARPITWYR